MRLSHYFHQWPSTALEPTAFTRSGSRCGVGFTDGFRGRGSAFFVGQHERYE